VAEATKAIEEQVLNQMSTLERQELTEARARCESSEKSTDELPEILRTYYARVLEAILGILENSDATENSQEAAP
jgi:hypothetical protein